MQIMLFPFLTHLGWIHKPPLVDGILKIHLERDEIINSIKPLPAEAEMKDLLCFGGHYDRILALVNKAGGQKPE